MRNNLIDTLKGILIYLVVLGHTIQVLNTNFDQNIIFKLIYSFHMPFFFLISGYLASFSLNATSCNLKKCVIDKFKYLVIPFLLWYGISFFINADSNIEVTEYFSRIFFGVDYGLWYLWILFLMYVTLYIVNKISKIFKYSQYIFLVSLIVILPNTSFLGMSLLKWYLIFFLLGMLVEEYQVLIFKNFQLMNNYTFIFILSFVFIMSVIFVWQRNFDIHSMINNFYIYAFLKLLIGLIGILTLTLICKKVKYCNVIQIQSIGVNSMGIYILNFPVIGYLSYYLNSNNIFFTVFISILSLIMSHYLSLFLSKIKYISILFGKTIKKEL